MAATSNIDQVVAYLKGFLDGWDFTRPGVDQSVGRDVKNTVVECIEERSALHQAPDGSTWPPNSTKEPPLGGYKGYKERKYGWPDNPNMRTAQMLSKTSLGAASTITKDEVLVAYGTNQPPDRSYAPTGYMSKADKKPTDLQKAEWAHSGGKHGVKRPFYGLGEGDAEAITDVCRDALHEYIRTSPYGVG